MSESDLQDNLKSFLTLKDFSAKEIEEMIDLYAAADLFVLPSLRDASPLTPIEASAAGLPLLVSNLIGNYEDVLIQEVNGWGFNPYESEEAKSILLKISSLTINELSIIGEKSKSIYNETFDTELCVKSYAEQLLKTYNKLK